MRRLITLTACVLALVASACEPPTKAPPQAGRVAVVGDSLTFQAVYYGGQLAGYDYDGKIGPGWQAETAQPRVTADVADPATSPQTLVIALGHNDVAQSFGRDGFTTEDRLQILGLALSPAYGACTAFVSPHYAGPDGTVAMLIEAYREYILLLAATWPDTIRVVDWRPTAVEHPEWIDPDGVHLVASDPASLGAYADTITAAADACDG